MPRLLTLIAALLLAPGLAFAHGPTPQKIEETIVIQAPPAAVWLMVKDFAGLAKWHAAVANCDGQGGNANGATRTVTLKSGGKLVDGLDEYDDAGKSYGYRLAQENLEAFPVSYYSATLTVRAKGDASEVEWTGRYYRGDTGNYPPETQDDAAATAAMSKFFRDGLESLKAKLEATR
ncbi:mxaD protein [Rhodopseudomonas rhenobacensis]|uniref:MxaD protein n=1 Tax=Rhodopseudomonas rhenobacensis TaxID=87461 RepID=A0A7W7Z3T6_9BRAD|nr:SRPBCC family protein [Rhodopseudomonas rhenobacensis]MBB5047142.1 mxaD protein [Rhodopseudomonas rhenobacensis]